MHTLVKHTGTHSYFSETSHVIKYASKVPVLPGFQTCCKEIAILCIYGTYKIIIIHCYYGKNRISI